ncbi:unnamed protein product [Amoebophrya sp. A120]|nr:unnamed protein product [Amoebophrya sp. A120]|eukprot:GSA120T00006068001.1
MEDAEKKMATKKKKMAVDKNKMDKDKMMKYDKLDKMKDKKDKGKKDKIILSELPIGINAKKKSKKDKLAKLGKAKNKEAKSKGKKKGSAKTRAAKANLIFPVARIHNRLKSRASANARVSGTTAVFCAAVMEYLVAELCELAGNRAKVAMGNNTVNKQTGQNKKARITPRLICMAVKEDKEFDELLKKATIREGGVIPLGDKQLKEQMNAHKRVAGASGAKTQVGGVPGVELGYGKDDKMKTPYIIDGKDPKGLKAPYDASLAGMTPSGYYDQTPGGSFYEEGATPALAAQFAGAAGQGLGGQ